MEAVKLRDRLLVFFSTPVLLGMSLGPGGAWSELSAIWPFDGPRGNSALAPSAAAVDDRGHVVWIDNRFRELDAFPANVLSDQPYWADNDVFALPLSSLMRSSAEASRLVPLRLTRDLQYAKRIRARNGERGVYVIWTGRAKVGKNLRSADAPPTFFIAVLPP